MSVTTPPTATPVVSGTSKSTSSSWLRTIRRLTFPSAISSLVRSTSSATGNLDLLGEGMFVFRSGVVYSFGLFAHGSAPFSLVVRFFYPPRSSLFWSSLPRHLARSPRTHDVRGHPTALPAAGLIIRWAEVPVASATGSISLIRCFSLRRRLASHGRAPVRPAP